MKTTRVLLAASSIVLYTIPLSTQAEMVGLAESELSTVSGKGGLSIEIPHIRVNAHASGSENDGLRTKGYTKDYVTREHDGGGETHYFVAEKSLAVDITGAFTVDIEGDGKLVIGLPDRMNFVGDGYSAKGFYLNNDGSTSSGGKMLNEISIKGNFDTGGTITMWGN